MKNWRSFATGIRSGTLQLNDADLARANRAKARFTLAATFRGIAAPGIAERTLDGYSALLSVFLAYTAAEQVGMLIGDRVETWKLTELELAQALRKRLGAVIGDIEEHFSSPTLRAHLLRFSAGEVDDVRIAATAIRVAVAHGSLTAAGARVRTRADRETFGRLSECLLSEAERRFGSWVESLLNCR